MQTRDPSTAVGVLGFGMLAAGVVVRLLGLPNQVALTAAGFVLLSLVFLPARFFGPAGAGLSGSWQRATGLAATAALPLTLGIGTMSVRGVSGVVVFGAAIALGVYAAWLLAEWRRDGRLPLGRRHWFLYSASVVCLVACIPSPTIVADVGYRGPHLPATYPEGRGPLVLFDQGHDNGATLAGSYRAFGRALTGDGYQVRPMSGPLTRPRIASARILVVVNALNHEALGNEAASPLSAFGDEEIASVVEWVSRGGSLMLVADERPFAGAAADLAAALGFAFLDGVADDERGDEDVFSRASGAIAPSSIADGRNRSERVSQVQTFVGQAISIPADATPVLLFPDGYRLWPSADAWRARRRPDGIPVAGCAQLAVRRHGGGRVAVVGDSSLFAAELERGLSWRRVGMNAPDARDNHRLLLNVVHWLDGLLP